MKILFVGLKHLDGIINGQKSYEYNNFFFNLKKIYQDVDGLFIDEEISKYGYFEMNKKILKISKNYNIIFFFAYKNDFKLNTLKTLKNNQNLKTICWMSDDDWRYEIYSRKFINHFDLIVTTYNSAFKKYKRDGEKNIFLSQWPSSPIANINDNIEKKIDVSFVGQRYGNRDKYIKSIDNNKLDLKVYGKGWNNYNFYNGDIKNIFLNSKINLNFTNSSTGISIKNLAKVIFNKSTDQKINLNKFSEMPKIFNNLILSNKTQIKSRPFEIMACKSFLLSEYSDGLLNYFEAEKDFDYFIDEKQLKEKINYYLVNREKREFIAKNGFQKILKYHSFEKRFSELFNFLNLTPIK